MRPAQLDIIREDCKNRISGSAQVLESLKGEHILITGGTGFMGTWLTEMISFLNDNYRFDTQMFLLSDRAHNFSTRAPHLAHRQDITLIERDVRSVIDIPEEISWIIHAAGNPDSRQHASDPLKIIDVIVNGTRTVLECASRLPNLKKFLNISSGLVYGVQPWEVDVIPEIIFGTLDCSSISSAYAEAKRLGETLCSVYRNQQRLPVVNARPFAFIGPYQLLDRPWAINNFIKDSLLGGPIRILGDGETVRSYMYPSDMSFWILCILIHGSIGTSYNIGSPDGVTLNQLAEKIVNCFSKKIKVITHFSCDERLKRSKFVPDTSLANNTLGLSSKVDLDTAIKRTILWNKVGLPHPEE